jgi:FkbM family methyltransferase
MIDFESKVQEFYSMLLRPGMVAIDVGAHVGRHGLEMIKCVAPGGFVLMFEPLPEQFSGLDACIRADHEMAKHAAVYPYALSDKVGETEFCVAVDCPGYSGIRERRYDTPTRVQRIQVPARRLDDEVGSLKRVDYIKIDTEGGEWHVLQGAAETIKRYRPSITFEFGESGYAAFGVDPGEVFRFFAKQSYAVLDILKRNLSEAEFCTSSRTQAVWDYIAVPREKMASLGLSPV